MRGLRTNFPGGARYDYSMRNRLLGRFLVAGICGASLLTSAAVRAADDASAEKAAAEKPATEAKGPPPAADDHWGFLNYYCSKCHNATDWAGGVAFDTMTQDNIPEDAETWEHAVRKLRGQLMPPPGNPQPAKEARRSFISYMENTLDTAAEKHPSPGRVALHRLNRKEYANAVADLLDVKVDVNSLLPEDNVSDGFDNVANVLQVTPSFLDQYVAAARSVAVQAIGDGSVKPMGVQYFARNSGSQYFHVEGLPLGTRGGTVVEHVFPADGEYELNIANMAVALWVFNMEFEHTLIATLDGKKFFETKIGGEEDMKSIDQKQDPAVDAINARLKGIRFNAPAGPHKVAVAFVQRTFAESDDKLYQQVPGGGQDRVLKVSAFEVKGPFKVTGMSDTPSRKRIFMCYPKTPAEEGPCADQIIETLAMRAFRRPLTGSDKAALMKFYEAGRNAPDGGNFDVGIRRAITAILASPSFLYRAEPVPQTAEAGSIYRINDLELASRLSFFLWSTVPDDELRKVAASGKLREPEVLKAQVKRMLADPRSQSLASSFAFQWLNIGKLAEIDPDMNIFPYAADPREDFRTEIKLFVDSVFREDRNVVDLLTASYTYLNERLALHYGIRDVRGAQWRRVELTDSARWGLLGKGGVLMLTSYPNRTAPVLRGAWILERISGTPPASPPPNVEALKDTKAGEKPKTLKEQMALHRTKPSCFSCHGVMDPLGFALENFDASGKWREKDRLAETLIDSSGELPDGSVVKGPDDLRNALAANPEQFVQTLTEKLMTYALGRTVEYHDMPTVRGIVRASAQDGYKFSSLVMNIVMSEPFQMRQVPKDDSVPVQKQASVTR
jgi:mono/diheme cytochrome c family protein